MLIFNFHSIGNKLLAVRRRNGLTQAEVTEKAGLSDRTYADIERGTVNMRIETLLKICGTLNVTPDEILTENSDKTYIPKLEDLLQRLSACSDNEKKTAVSLLEVYLNSLSK